MFPGTRTFKFWVRLSPDFTRDDCWAAKTRHKERTKRAKLSA